MTGERAETRYRIEGMDCAGCAAKIETAARRVEGVETAAVSVMGRSMTLRHAATTNLAVLERRIEGLGYGIRRAASPAELHARDTAHQHDHPHDHAHDHGGDRGREGDHGHAHDHGPSDDPWWKSPRGLLTIASGAGLVAAYVAGKIFPALGHWPFIAAMLIGLVPIARRGLAAALAGTPFSIETLMSIAAVGAVVIGAGEEAAVVVFLFLVGELLEGVAAGRARASIQSMADLVPKTAMIERDGRAVEIAADALTIGDVIVVRPGDRIAADGDILSGASAINEAPITGESVAVSKGAGAKVFAGAINGDGVIRVRVTAAAADNTIARVVKLVEEAQEAKAPTERFIDRFSRVYTPAVLIAGALVATLPPLVFGGAWAEWIYKGLAVLLIGCPCALVISTPAAIAAALSSGARRGLLMKGGAVLETLGRVTAACFDKTGTLTEGKPRVVDVIPFGRSERDVLGLAAALEQGANHPLAQAILAKAAETGLTPPAATDAKAIGGKGVEGRVEQSRVFLGSPNATKERVSIPDELGYHIISLNKQGKTVSLLLVDDEIAGIITMRDEPRADAREGLAALARLDVSAVMLTGDNRRAAEAVGAQLGVAVRAELMPADKQGIVAEMRAKGQIVAKIGDGINDAPALATADVGIAMGGGTDVALETADAAVLHRRVMDVARMVALSRRTMRNIRQNITVALGLKAAFLVTTILGVTGLWPAIIADTGATVLVTANALRLLRADATEPA